MSICAELMEITEPVIVSKLIFRPTTVKDGLLVLNTDFVAGVFRRSPSARAYRDMDQTLIVFRCVDGKKRRVYKDQEDNYFVVINGDFLLIDREDFTTLLFEELGINL